MGDHFELLWTETSAVSVINIDIIHLTIFGFGVENVPSDMSSFEVFKTDDTH